MGVGFTIPIIMMAPDEILDAQDIARVIGNFGAFLHWLATPSRSAY
jgi:hypothetical protein